MGAWACDFFYYYDFEWKFFLQSCLFPSVHGYAIFATEGDTCVIIAFIVKHNDRLILLDRFLHHPQPPPFEAKFFFLFSFFFFFFHSLTIYFSWHAELPPERELVSNECHAFYVFWFLCSSRRETRADDF